MESYKIQEHKVDIVVVGAGGAGLRATFGLAARLARGAAFFDRVLLLVSLIVIRHRSLATSSVAAGDRPPAEHPHVNSRSLHEIYFLQIL